MANTRQTFEAVFRDVIVPKIMEEVQKTGIAPNACDWAQNVRFSSSPPIDVSAR